MSSSLLPLPWYTCPDILFLLESAYGSRDVSILTYDNELIYLLYIRTYDSTDSMFRPQLESYWNHDQLGPWIRNPHVHFLINSVYSWMWVRYIKDEYVLDVDEIRELFGDWEKTIFDHMNLL